MEKRYKTYQVIHLRNGEELVTGIKESEYYFADQIKITEGEMLADLPVEIKLKNDDLTVQIKPSDILYILNHRKLVEVEDSEDEEIEKSTY